VKLKELLNKELTKKQLEVMPTSFDTVGDILIFNDFPEELKKKEKIIGNKILNSLSNIKVVTKKTGKYSGTYRTPKLKILAGERRKETIHKENNTRLKLHVEKAYFSTRTATERKRIFELVKKGEKVLVMFSGIAPLPCTIARNSKPSKILGIEINPEAHKYAEENVKLNKITNIELKNGDVRKLLPKIKDKFDRILMPLPKTAEEFLALALTKVKKGGMIHLYSFINPKELPEFKKKIKEICKESKKSCRITKVGKCGQFSPEEFRMSLDLKIL